MVRGSKNLHSKRPKITGVTVNKRKIKTRSYAHPLTIVKDAGWDVNKTMTQNYKTVGLARDPNVAIDRSIRKSSIKKRPVAEDDNVDRETLGKKLHEEIDSHKNLTENPATRLRKLTRPISEEHYRYMSALVSKHGNDLDKMFKDYKLNDMQHPKSRLEKMLAKYNDFIAENPE